MDEQHPQLPPPAAAPHSSGSLPMSPQPKSAASLAIALVVSAVLLLAAAGVAYWLMTKSGGITTINQNMGDGSASVKKLSFVAPATLPASYVKTDQTAVASQSIDYFDANAGCRITTYVTGQTNVQKPTDDNGIKTTVTHDGGKYTLADTDGSHKYDFASTVMDQDVTLPGVNFSHQTSIVAFKTFGLNYASITFSCRSDSWDTKKSQLESLIQTFKVKTER